MSLHYYDHKTTSTLIQDYEAVSADRWTNATTDRPLAQSVLPEPTHPVYNGNISMVARTLQPTTGWWAADTDNDGQKEQGTPEVLAWNVHYDQLNRFRTGTTWKGLTPTNDWEATTAGGFYSEYTYDANGNIRTAKRNDGGGSNYDLFDYQYHEQSGVLQHNRLYDLVDAADVNLTDDIPIGGNLIPDNGSVSAEAVNEDYNYRYDPLGNLVHDEREEIETIEWTVAGKVERVLRTDGSDRKPLTFGYGPSGHRVMKQAGELYGDPTAYREHYVHDAQGNIMAIYKHSLIQSAPPVYSLQLNSRPIYGSDRLGTDELPVELANHAPYDPSTAPDGSGARRYELKDHLGNVMAVVTDRLTPAYIDGDNTVDAYKADVVAMQDYEPFGSLLPGRNYSSSNYNFGFQGQLKDDEIYGAPGTSYAFEYRMHDARVGRFLSIDPLAGQYPHNSPYAFSENRVIDAFELEGLEKVQFMEDAQAKWDYLVLKVSNAWDILVDVVTIEPPPYTPPKDAQGNIVVDHTSDAVEHYYRGNGRNVELGPKTQEEIKTSEDMGYFRDRIVSGKTPSPASGNGPINMTTESGRSYHVGRSRMSYNTTCTTGDCTTTFRIEDDGFWDIFWGEDQTGPNGEIGGTPYRYNAFEWSETYPNPGYAVGADGAPAASPSKVEPGKGPPNESRYSSSSLPLQSP